MALPSMVAGIFTCDPVRVLASERARVARKPMRVEGFMVDGSGRVCCSFRDDV